MAMAALLVYNEATQPRHEERRASDTVRSHKRTMRLIGICKGDRPMDLALVIIAGLVFMGVTGWLAWQWWCARCAAQKAWVGYTHLQRDYRAVLTAQKQAKEQRTRLLRDLQEQQYAYGIIEAHLCETQTQLAACRARLQDAERALGVQSPLEDWLVTLRGNAPTRDDLTTIPGIGSIYAAKLHAGGIHRFDELSDSTPARLATIIQAPMWHQIDYADWIAQARALARTGMAAHVLAHGV
jgi:predicted flap endonuclease-1-like 5' DNA nuclease